MFAKNNQNNNFSTNQHWTLFVNQCLKRSQFARHNSHVFRILNISINVIFLKCLQNDFKYSNQYNVSDKISDKEPHPARGTENMH